VVNPFFYFRDDERGPKAELRKLVKEGNCSYKNKYVVFGLTRNL